MQRRYVTIDVFTDRPFGGNPLAVVLDAAGLATAQMQAVAREFNYSETTFVLPPSDPAHTAHVRIFTPGSEIPFAGHPNVGTALVLARRAGAALQRVVFEEAAGLVPLEITSDGGVPVAAELTAPQKLVRGASAEAAAVAAGVGLTASDVVDDFHPPLVASVGLAFLFAEIANRGALGRAHPDASAVSALLSRTRAAGLLLYTRHGANAGWDVQARMFSPQDGIGEDSATGSAAAALAALHAELAGAGDGEFELLIGQGIDMGRPSLLRARAVKRHGAVVSAHVGGRGIEFMQGSFELAGA